MGKIAWFESAVRVFLNPRRVDREDSRRDYGEERRITLAIINERLFAAAYTRRGEIIRVISARKVSEREKRNYHATLSA